MIKVLQTNCLAMFGGVAVSTAVAWIAATVALERLTQGLVI